MAASADKTQALAALADLAVLAPQLKAAARAFYLANGNEYAKAFPPGPDAQGTGRTSTLPDDIAARLDGIVAGADLAAAIVSAA